MNTGTIGGLIDYLDQLVDKGRATVGATRPLKIATTKVMETVEGSGWKNVSTDGIDADDYISRFKNMTADKGTYTTSSYDAYSYRLKRALSWYQNSLQTPGWVPSVGKSRGKAAVEKPENSAANDNPKNVREVNKPKEIPMRDGELINFSYLLRPDTVVNLYLPPQITGKDVQRLKKFLDTLPFEAEGE